MAVNIDFAREVADVSLTERMKGAYLDYAMSVIVGRALPDVRDGLKPVQRRILYAMSEAGNDWNKPFKKSARIVGDVLGKYHPHGGEAVYDALVRIAQSFNMRLPLVDGQGNFGSVDGDKAAAMRYTEVRLARASHALLDDLEKETVAFVPNYDGAEREPVVLPARFPALLVNGASGIAVGMATNIPPHNLGEAVDACLLLLKKPDATVDMLAKKMPAPDFPTGALIYGIAGVREAYKTGNGRVVMRARAHFEDMDKSGARQAVIIDELPYQVNKASLVERIADLARRKEIEGISDLRDESDRDGIRVVVELRRGENAEVALNRLYKKTQMQENFSVNIVALADGEPKTMNLLDMLRHFLEHRREVVVNRAIFDLEKTRTRAHLLEGYAAAVANMDAVVQLIQSSRSPAEAEERLLARAWDAPVVAEMLSRLDDPSLMRSASHEAGRGLQKKEKGKGKDSGGYLLSAAQAKAILEMRLARLTAMEREKIRADYSAAVDAIAELLQLLADPEKIRTVIQSELETARKMFATPRRSEIVEGGAEIDIESLIAEEPMVVTLSHGNYVKRQPVSDYRAQKRGGVGKAAASLREDDFISRLFVASTHDYLLIFTNRGRAYWKKVYELPLASRASRGRPIVNLLPLAERERVQTVLAVREFDAKRSIVFATAKGVVKKTLLSAYANPRANGIIAINLGEDDSLINAALAADEASLLLFTDAGKAIHFRAGDLRAIGRSGRGVRGMRLKPEKALVVALLALSPEEAKEKAILIAAEKGRGKRTAADKFPLRGRGGQGVFALKVSEKTGPVVGAVVAGAGDELMLITDGGVMVRTAMDKISKLGRNTQGVGLIKPGEGSRLIGIARIVAENGQENGG